MGNLADIIEQYIWSMLEAAQQGTLELQRHELAKHFECVPSQINYVLQTRFTVDRGFIIESRRGGGGYIRIVRVNLAPHERLLEQIHEIVGEATSAKEAEDLLWRLNNDGLLSNFDIARVKITLLRELGGIPDEFQDVFRARLLKALLGMLLSR